jgi:F0F1-type ATP synthase assembly protein I
MQEKKPTDPRASLSNYGKHSSMAFQMAVIICIGVFGGIKLDHWLKFKFPVFTVVLSLFATGIAVYYVIRDLLRMK